MTRPSLISFVFPSMNEAPKVFLRTLLYCTSDRGQYVQNMYVRLTRDGIAQDFNLWHHGDDKTVRGSGIFASRSGVVCYHHFVLTKEDAFQFSPGDYNVQVFVEPVDDHPKLIFEHELSFELTEEQSRRNKTAVLFNWEPSFGAYGVEVNSQNEIYIV